MKFTITVPQIIVMLGLEFVILAASESGRVLSGIGIVSKQWNVGIKSTVMGLGGAVLCGYCFYVMYTIKSRGGLYSTWGDKLLVAVVFSSGICFTIFALIYSIQLLY